MKDLTRYEAEELELASGYFVRWEDIEPFSREREVAMKTLATVLGEGNENVKRNDLAASVNDLAHRLTMQTRKPE